MSWDVNYLLPPGTPFDAVAASAREVAKARGATLSIEDERVSLEVREIWISISYMAWPEDERWILSVTSSLSGNGEDPELTFAVLDEIATPLGARNEEDVWREQQEAAAREARIAKLHGLAPTGEAPIAADTDELVAVSPDGRWRVRAAGARVEVAGHVGFDTGYRRVLALAFSPDGLLAVGGGGVQVWDVGAVACVARLDADEWVPALLWCGADELLAIGRVDDVRLHDVVHGIRRWRKVLHARDAYGCSTHAAARSPDGERAVIAGSDGLLKIVELATGKAGKRIRGLDKDETLRAVAWSDAGIAVVGDAGVVSVVDPARGTVVASALHEGAKSVAWDGATIVTRGGGVERRWAVTLTA